MIPKYVKAILCEIDWYGALLGPRVPVQTIFFGGGTPSLISAEQYEEVLGAINKTFDCSEIKEISLEANPGTVSPAYLQALRESGFNRISFGLQTNHQKHLDLMGRIHNHDESVQAVAWAKLAGFDNINVDLIYGLPDQTIEEWEQTLTAIRDLQVQHISLYALGVEENTPLWTWIHDGKVNAPDDDLAAGMYDLAVRFLQEARFTPYEISNFALAGMERDFRCLHNLQYWRNQPYIGIGAGAHGFVGKARTENQRTVPAYIHSMEKSYSAEMLSDNPALDRVTEIDRMTEMQETMMVGLRLLQEGVSIPIFTERFGKSPMEVFGNEIQNLLKNGLLYINGQEKITIPAEKVMVSNLIFQHFVG